TDPATLTVNTAPVVNLPPVDQTGCEGTTVTFQANANSIPAPTVQWEVSTDGGAQFSTLAGETRATLTLTNIMAAQSGNQYRAGLSNACGSSTSSVAVLTVNVSPVVSTSPVDMTACEGSSVTFTATATGTPAPSMQWEVSTNTGATWSVITGETTG